MQPPGEQEVALPAEIEIDAALLGDVADTAARVDALASCGLAEEFDLARAGRQKARQQAQQARLARAVWPQHAQALAGGHLQAEAVQRACAVAKGQGNFLQPRDAGPGGHVCDAGIGGEQITYSHSVPRESRPSRAISR